MTLASVEQLEETLMSLPTTPHKTHATMPDTVAHTDQHTDNHQDAGS